MFGDPFVIPRQWVASHGGSGEIESLLHKLRRRPDTINLSMSGYDEDSRDLYEIPDVCEYARWLQSKYPGLYSFLDEYSKAVWVCWLLGPFPREDIDSPQFARKLRTKMNECERDAIR